MKQFTRTLILSFGLFLLFKSLSYCQELQVKSFDHLENNTTARINKRRDVNGQHCAILILKHNFKDFKVETGKDYEDRVDKLGETWLWLSPDEYRLVIKKEGYVPLAFDLKGKLSPLETYEMVVTDGYGQVVAKAENAEFFLDNKKVGNDSVYLSLKEGQYTLLATREKYYHEEKFINLKAGVIHFYNIDLKPIIGHLIINGDVKNTTIFIDENKITYNNEKIELLCGQYNIKAIKKGYYDFEKKIELSTGENIIDLKMMKNSCYAPNYQTSIFYMHSFYMDGKGYMNDINMSHFNIAVTRNVRNKINNCYYVKFFIYSGFFKGVIQQPSGYVDENDFDTASSGIKLGIGFGLPYFQMALGGGFSKGASFFEVIYKIDFYKKYVLIFSNEFYGKDNTAISIGFGLNI